MVINIENFCWGYKVLNAEGFLKYSKIYRGNISESSTLERTIEDLSKNSSHTGRTPLIVMDAGIMTEDNAKMLKQKGYDYIAVSRQKLKDYKEVSAFSKNQSKRKTTDISLDYLQYPYTNRGYF